MRTFVPATAGMMYPRGVHKEAAEDAAFAKLERQVGELAGRVKEVLKPGVIDKMVADAIKPFEGAIRAKAEQIRNSAKPPRTGIRGAFRLPAGTTEAQEAQQRIANAERGGFRLPKGD